MMQESEPRRAWLKTELARPQGRRDGISLVVTTPHRNRWASRYNNEIREFLKESIGPEAVRRSAITKLSAPTPEFGQASSVSVGGLDDEIELLGIVDSQRHAFTIGPQRFELFRGVPLIDLHAG